MLVRGHGVPAQALRLAEVFDDPKVDVVAYGCTAAGFISGPSGDKALARSLTNITGKAVVTTARSISHWSSVFRHRVRLTPIARSSTSVAYEGSTAMPAASGSWSGHSRAPKVRWYTSR